MKRLFGGIILLLLFAGLISCGGENAVVKTDPSVKYSFKMNIPDGFTWKNTMETNIEQVIESSMGAGTLNLTSTYKNTSSLIGKNDDGSRRFKVVIDKLNFIQGKTNPKLEDIKDLAGKSMVFTVDSNGKTRKVDTDDNLTFNLFGQNVDLMQNPGELFIQLPSEPLGIGQSWTRPITPIEGALGKNAVSGNMVYTITGETLKNGIRCVKAKMNGKLHIKSSGNYMISTTDFEGDSDLDGEILIDLEKGIIVLNTIKSKTEVEVYTQGSVVDVTVFTEIKAKADY